MHTNNYNSSYNSSIHDNNNNNKNNKNNKNNNMPAIATSMNLEDRCFRLKRHLSLLVAVAVAAVVAVVAVVAFGVAVVDFS